MYLEGTAFYLLNGVILLRIWKIFCAVGGGAALLFVFGSIAAKDEQQVLLTMLCAVGSANFSALSYIAYLLSRNQRDAQQDTLGNWDS